VLRCKKGHETVPMIPANAEKGSRVATLAHESGKVDALFGKSSNDGGRCRPVKAVILSAGQGSRLLPLTADRPKCLIDFAGRTLLDWQLDDFPEDVETARALVAGWAWTRTG
jgi:hypothetical protein